ncbi:uncharacterized protein PAC_04957 [Phialocephala subalpina]|uniref:Uncharacterized protein n=1 Tax=Phialocephala subalpina TaxID=576137 RepID=A0A1L7WQQ1_9HELO|nr:uncharacterized protein PAC_04957 [Phialocephala subalpina]
MQTKTFLAVFALATAAAAVPVPNSIWGAEPSKVTDIMQSVESAIGSPFNNGNGNGNGNAAGNGNDGNAAGNGANAGSGDGNKNDFGNSNDILSGNSGLKIGRNDKSSGSSESIGQWVDGLLGSPFNNGNGNGALLPISSHALARISRSRRVHAILCAESVLTVFQLGDGNSAGNGNDDNASGNGAGAGSNDGNGNVFGNGNDILSGNSGLSIGKKVRRTPIPETPGSYISGIGDAAGELVDAVVVPLEPGFSTSVIGSPSNNGNSNGDNNSAGNNNSGNGSNNGAGAGSNNGQVRDLPDDALDIIPDQTVDALQLDFSQLFSDGPTDVGGILDGAITGDDTSEKFNGKKRQVLTGVEDVIAQDLVGLIPRKE